MNKSSSIICNSGPLIALCLLKKLSLLQAFYQRVIIPEVVYREILHSDATRPGAEELAGAHWIEVQPIVPDPILTAMLDPGEASVLTLARSMGITHVLIDERRGRKIARTILELTVTGTARLLVDAARSGLIVSAHQELLVLRNNGYWLGDNILEWAKSQSTQFPSPP